MNIEQLAAQVGFLPADWQLLGKHLERFAGLVRAAATADERERINALLAAIREHWIKANGEDSMSVSALDQIAEVIADGSYVQEQGAAAIRALAAQKV